MVTNKNVIAFPINSQPMKRTGEATKSLLEGLDDQHVAIELQMESMFSLWCVKMFQSRSILATNLDAIGRVVRTK